MSKIKTWVKENKMYAYLLIAFFVIFSFLLNTVWTIQLRFENKELRAEIEELDNLLKLEKQEFQEATTDRYIEEQATQRLGMVKSDETPVKIYEVKKQEEKTDEENIKQDKIRIFFKDWYKQLKIWVDTK